MLVDKRLNLQADQLVQTHFQYGVGLLLGEHKLGGHDLGLLGLEFDAVHLALHQACLRHIAVLGAPQDLDDQVDDVASLDQPLLNLLLLLLLRQKVGVLPGCDLKLKVDVSLQDSL